MLNKNVSLPKLIRYSYSSSSFSSSLWWWLPRWLPRPMANLRFLNAAMGSRLATREEVCHPCLSKTPHQHLFFGTIVFWENGCRNLICRWYWLILLRSCIDLGGLGAPLHLSSSSFHSIGARPISIRQVQMFFFQMGFISPSVFLLINRYMLLKSWIDVGALGAFLNLSS